MTLIYQIEATDEEAKKIMVRIGELMGIVPEVITPERLPHKLLIQTVDENNLKIKNQPVKTSRYPHLKIVQKKV